MAIILDCDLLPERSKSKSLVDEYDDLELEQPMSFNQFRPSETKKDEKASEISKVYFTESVPKRIVTGILAFSASASVAV